MADCGKENSLLKEEIGTLGEAIANAHAELRKIKQECKDKLDAQNEQLAKIMQEKEQLETNLAQEKNAKITLENVVKQITPENNTLKTKIAKLEIEIGDLRAAQSKALRQEKDIQTLSAKVESLIKELAQAQGTQGK